MILQTRLAVANFFVLKHHKHLGKVIGHKFSLAFIHNHKTVGVIICGRPICRHYNHHEVIEVTRLCTDGSVKNVCSRLYSAAAKLSKKKGYKKMITYSRVDELATSIKASNFVFSHLYKSKQWSGRKSHEIIDKIMWYRNL